MLNIPGAFRKILIVSWKKTCHKFILQIRPYDKRRHFFALVSAACHCVCTPCLRTFGLYHRMGTLVRRVLWWCPSHSPRRLFNTGAHLVVYSSVQSLGILIIWFMGWPLRYVPSLKPPVMTNRRRPMFWVINSITLSRAEAMTKNPCLTMSNTSSWYQMLSGV